MSQQAQKVLMLMVKELSSLKHGNRAVVEWCYDYVLQGYAIEQPQESKEEIVTKALETMKEIFQNN
jgi:hypothetical protein